MNLKEIFSQNPFTRKKDGTQNMKKHRIECDTKELKAFVTKWTGNDGWKFENFADFLELVGVKTPVKLKDLEWGKRRFKCVTADGTEVLISVNFGDYIEWCSEICIEEGEEKKVYLTNSKGSIGGEVPRVTLRTRVIKRNGKELTSYYESSVCLRTLKIDDTHILKVEIHNPNNNTDKSEKLALKNYLEIENYLIGLEGTSDVVEVYDTIISLLECEEGIKNSDKILVSYNKKVKEDEKVLSRILVSKGQLQEYAIHENGQIFHIFQDGSWKYYCYLEDVSISYLKKERRFNIQLTELEEDLENIYRKTMFIGYAKKRISEIWKSMENTRRFS